MSDREAREIKPFQVIPGSDMFALMDVTKDLRPGVQTMREVPHPSEGAVDESSDDESKDTSEEEASDHNSEEESNETESKETDLFSDVFTAKPATPEKLEPPARRKPKTLKGSVDNSDE